MKRTLRASLTFLVLSAFTCGGGFLLGSVFFPIGPDGITDRDLIVRQVSDFMLMIAVLLFMVGLYFLLNYVFNAWLDRRQR